MNNENIQNDITLNGLQDNFTPILLKQAQCIILVLDLNANIIFFNDYFEKLSGFSMNEVYGKNWIELFIPEIERKEINIVFNNIVNNSKDFFSYKNNISLKNGQHILINWGNTFLKDSFGNKTGIVSFGIELPEQGQKNEKSAGNHILFEQFFKERIIELENSSRATLNMMQDAEIQKQLDEEILEALRKSQAELARSQAMANLGSYRWDIQSGEIIWSDELKLIWGISGDVPPKEQIESMIHPKDINRIYKAKKMALEENHPFNMEYRIIRADGSERWIRDHAEICRDDDGKAILMYGSVLDITDSKKMEENLRLAKDEAERATHAKSDFLANMSHEIRTPLNAIVGLAHLALKTNLSNKREDYLNKIIISSNILKGIINDILDFSKIEAGKLEIETVSFQLDEVLNKTDNLCGLKALEKGIKMEIRKNPDVPNYLIGDSLRLNQVLLNLTNNAVKFTQNGDVQVHVEVEKKWRKSIKLKFSVKDTGIGMTEEQMSIIFHPFSQGETSIARKFGGSGLGLSISKALVELMGGEIFVCSHPNQGSLFYFTAIFSLQKEKEKIIDSNTFKYNTIAKPINNICILLVEDNEINQQVVVELLEHEGIKVIIAENGYEALNLLKETNSGNEINAILMDLQTPIMDGFETTKEIRKIKAYNKLPIIAMSAYAVKEIIDRCLKAGMNDFITKPVDLNNLFSILKKRIKKMATFSYLHQTKKKLAKEATAFFPKIPGINIPNGLNYVNGNKEFYVKILKRFKENYSSFPEDITKYMESKKNEEAFLSAHSLKGIAGIIGAEQLHLLAGDLEIQLENINDKSWEIIVNKIGINLKSLFKGIQSSGILKIFDNNKIKPGKINLKNEY